MNEPRDYGLDAHRTLAFVVDPTPPPGFVQHWTHWQSVVWADAPTLLSIRDALPTHDAARLEEHGVTHVFQSMGDVTIGTRLTLPEGEVRGVVITTHGYGCPDVPLNDHNPFTERGLAFLQVRVRGYPGSHLSTGHLSVIEDGYITRGLLDEDTTRHWTLSGAVADLVNAFRAVRARFGAATPISIHGESFGGGLAVIAASQIIGRDHVERLALGVPTFGAWAWRFAQPVTIGAGAELAIYRRANPEHRERIDALLHLHDAVIHARRVVCPTICKLALLDEVVPAPSAAAIFNALGSDPGRKWRYVTRYGHFDGGMADLRRHALYESMVADFFDVRQRPRAIMQAWQDRLPLPADEA